MKNNTKPIIMKLLNLKTPNIDEETLWGLVNYSPVGNINSINSINLETAVITLHNLLPGKDGILDGHYYVYIDTQSGNYLIKKKGGYGSLTVMTKPEEPSLITRELIPRERALVESYVATALLKILRKGPQETYICFERPEHEGYQILLAAHGRKLNIKL